MSMKTELGKGNMRDTPQQIFSLALLGCCAITINQGTKMYLIKRIVCALGSIKCITVVGARAVDVLFSAEHSSTPHSSLPSNTKWKSV